MHHHHLNKIFHLKSDLGRLYVHVAILGFASSLVSIFIPIFLLVQGFSLTQVFLFLLVDWGLFGLVSPLYGKIIQRLGMREVILLKTPIFALVLLSLYYLPDSELIRSLYLLIAAIKGFSASVHSLSIQSMFAVNMGEKKNENTSKLMAFPKLAGLLGPAIGGYVIVSLGFGFLFASVFVILLLAILPLWFMKDTVNHPEFDFKELIGFKNKKKEFFKMALFGYITFVYMAVIPLAIYLKSVNELNTGMLVTAIAFVGALFTVFIGKLCDRRESHKIMNFGAVLHMILFLVLGFITNEQLFYWLVLLSGFVSVLVMVPFETAMFQKAKETKPLEYTIFKEFSLYWGRLALLITMIIFSTISSGLFSGGILGFVWIMF